jgi:hypothetical protein
VHEGQQALKAAALDQLTQPPANLRAATTDMHVGVDSRGNHKLLLLLLTQIYNMEEADLDELRQGSANTGVAREHTTRSSFANSYIVCLPGERALLPHL